MTRLDRIGGFKHKLDSMTDSRPTSERILDVAEELFASTGYHATSLGDIADRVGIRTPSLYNHFKNKEALYAAVLERLMAHFRPIIAAAAPQPGRAPHGRREALAWARRMVECYFAHPNFARLLQHAALAETPIAGAQIQALFEPLFAPVTEGARMPQALQPWAVMDFNNLLVSYITLAPLYRDLIGIDPMAPEGRARHVEMVLELVDAALSQQALRPAHPRGAPAMPQDPGTGHSGGST